MITIQRKYTIIKAKDYQPKPIVPQRHVRATSWEGLTEANQKLFKSVASEIKSKYPQANCYAFGSRVNGNYTDDSDIDMLISGVTELEYNKIKASIKHELNIDLKLGNEHSKQLIQIP
jgi:predicted nucleotidyltransferase